MSCQYPNADEYISKKNSERNESSNDTVKIVDSVNTFQNTGVRVQDSLGYKAIVEMGMNKMIMALNNAFPNISFIRTTEGDPSYIGSDGNVYFNVNKYNPMAPLHELGHIFLYSASTSEDTELRKSAGDIMMLAKKHISMKSDLYYRVRSMYGSDVSAGAFENEVATFMLSEKNFQDPSVNPKDTQKKNAIRRFWDNVVRKILGWLGFYSKNQLRAINSDSIASLANIFDRFVYDWLNGNVKSNITRNNMVKLLDTLDAHQLSMKEQARDWKDIDRVLMKAENHDSIIRNADYNNYVSAIIEHISDKIDTLEVYGKRYAINFKGKEGKELDDMISKLANDIVEDVEKKREVLMTNYINFFNDVDMFDKIDKLSDKEFDRIFMRTIDKFRLPSLLVHLGFSNYNGKNTAKVMRLSEAISMYPWAFEGIKEEHMGQNPLVIIHKEQTRKGNRGLNMSLVNLTFTDFGADTNFYRGYKLFCEHLSDTKQNLMGIDIPASYLGMTKFQMGMQALKILKQNPGNTFRRVGIMKASNNMIPGFMDLSAFKHQLAALRDAESRFGQFLDVLPDEMTSMIRSPETNDIDTDADLILVLLNYMYDNYEQLKEDEKDSKQLRSMIDILEDFIINPGNKDNLMFALEKRKMYLEKFSQTTPRTFDEKTRSEERRLIGSALSLLRSRSGVRNNALSDFSLISMWFTPVQDLPSDLIQTFNHVIKDAHFQIQGVADKLYKERIEPLLNKFKVKMAIQDDSQFEKLFIHHDELDIPVYDNEENLITDGNRKKGVPKRFMTGEMISKPEHMELNKTAVRRNNPHLQITEEDIALGKAITDLVYDLVRELLVHKQIYEANTNVFTYNTETGFYEIDQAKLDRIVNTQMRQTWKRGQIPIIGRTTTELFSKGKFMKGLESWISKQGHDNRYMNEAVELFQENYQDGHVPHVFGKQVFDRDNRNALLGIIKSGDKVIYTGQKKSTFEPSYNIETMIKYFLGDTYTKIIMEEDVVPAYHDLQLAHKDNILRYNVSQKHGEKTAKIMFDVHALQEHTNTFGTDKKGQALERGFRTLVSIESVFGTAFSLPVFVTSTVGNNVNIILNTIANKLSGDVLKIFTPTQYAQAKIEIVKNFKKCDALMNMYQVWDRDLRTWYDDPRFRKLMKDPYNSRIPNIMNWWSDYLMRMEIMVAQMLYDGTWEAHDFNKEGIMAYDATKDKRYQNYFKKGNKEKAEEEKALMDDYVKNLVKDRRLVQLPDELPKRAYDLKDQSRFSWIAKEFSIGAFGSTERPVGNDFIVVKALNQFKMFLNTLVDNRLGKYKSTEEGGFKVVQRDALGRPMVGWQNYEKEGTWRTVAKYFVNGTGMVRAMRLLTPEGASMTPGKFAKLTPKQKFAFIRTSGDVMVTVLGLMLISMITALMDDDDKEGSAHRRAQAMKHSRMFRAFQDGMLTYLSLTPYDLKKTSGLDGSIFPVVGMIKSIINLASFQGTSKDFAKITPGRATYKSIMEIPDMIE